MQSRSYAFGSSARLKKRSEINRCRDTGEKVYSKHFLLLLCEAPEEQSRLGITVTTKIDKRAVVRNRIKRRIREVFRLNRYRLKNPVEIVVVARRDSGEIEYKDFEREILGALTSRGFLLPASH